MKKSITYYPDCNILQTLKYSPKIERDAKTAYEICMKVKNGIELTQTDRMKALMIVQCSYHDKESSKIVGASSVDSSCHGCDFCQEMRKAGENDRSIICNDCYDCNQENRMPNVRERHTINMIILATIEFSVEELSIIPCTSILRFNSSGDCPNLIYAMNCVRFAYAHSFADSAIWAKNTAPVVEAFKKLGKPENMTFIQSSKRINTPDKPCSEYVDAVFTVYLTEDDLQEALKNGAMECNGKKCFMCGWKCYKHGWPHGCNIAELFLGSKKAIKEIQKYLESKNK